MEQEKMMLLQKYGHIRQWVGDDGENGAAPACRGMTGSEWLMEKIAHELQDRDYYLTLARRGGIGSRELFRMAAEEEHHARRLKAMWFLAGGEGMKEERAEVPCVPQKKAEALRQRYSEECRAAEEYLAMAETGRGCTAEVLRAMAREEQHHAEKLLQILERLV